METSDYSLSLPLLGIVEGVDNMKIRDDGRKVYLIRWEGFDERTWEPEGNVGGCSNLLEEFLKVIPRQCGR